MALLELSQWQETVPEARLPPSVFGLLPTWGSPHPIEAARRQEEDHRHPRPRNLEKMLFIFESTQKNCLVICRELAGERETRAD